MDDLRAETPQVPPQQPPQSSGLKQIRTFQGDVADALSRQNESIYSIQHQEVVRRGDASGTPSAVPSHKLAFFGAGLALIVIASAGAWFTYTTFLAKTAPPVIAVPASRFLSPESETTIDVSTLSRETLFQAMAEATDRARPGELRHIILKQGTSSEATVSQFFATLETSAPGSLVRAFQPSFMFGTLGENRFMIMKLASYENAFPGMLSWESSMPFDIGPLFSTGNLLQALGSTPVFKDVIYRNKDVRAVYVTSDGDGTGALVQTPVLLYSFLDQEFLIITESPETLQTLIDRLTREKLTR